MASLYVFVHDNSVYSSPNSPTLPPIPKLEFLSTERGPSDAQVLSWATDAYPQVAIVPSHPRFDCPLFKRFIHKSKVVLIGIQWQLDQETMESWYRLETNLRSMANTLAAGGIYPLEYSFFPFPSSFGYVSKHKNRSIAIKCAVKSRDAFIQLGAMCSMGIARHLTEQDLHAETPKWVRLLVDHGVHPVWIDNFRKS